MSALLPFILIVGALCIIIAVVVRKYPQLTLLDVDTIPEVQQKNKKNELVRRRAEERLKEAHATWQKRFMPVKNSAEKTQTVFRSYVGKVVRKAEILKKEKEVVENDILSDMSNIPTPSDVRTMVRDGLAALENGNYEAAEKEFIGVIRVDMKNTDAYRGLGDVYFAQGQFKEAEETYAYLVHIDPHDDTTYVRLADIAEKRNDIRKAVDYLEQAVLINDSLPARFVRLADLLSELGQTETALEAMLQALDIEPENPRFLDKFLEISISLGRRDIAEDAYQRLRMVNPENNKLVVFKERIRQLPA